MKGLPSDPIVTRTFLFVTRMFIGRHLAQTRDEKFQELRKSGVKLFQAGRELKLSRTPFAIYATYNSGGGLIM